MNKLAYLSYCQIGSISPLKMRKRQMDKIMFVCVCEFAGPGLTHLIYLTLSWK